MRHRIPVFGDEHNRVRAHGGDSGEGDQGLAPSHRAVAPLAKPESLPGRVVARSLRRRFVRAVLRYVENRGPVLADSITYRALFSVFAAVLLAFSAAALWLGGNAEAMAGLADALDRFLPGLSEIVNPEKIDAPRSFSIVGALSVLGLLWATISAIGSLRKSLRALADELQDDIPFLWAQLRNLIVAVGFGGLLVIGAALSGAAALGVRVASEWFGISLGDGGSLLVRSAAILVVFLVDTAAIALAFRGLSGVKAPARVLWAGSALGGVGLVVLQELSGLFVRGAQANPLLASFAALIALLIWFNLSAQVILLASCVIIVANDELRDPVRERYGALTLKQHRRRRAEDRMRAAVEELRIAQADERDEARQIRERHG